MAKTFDFDWHDSNWSGAVATVASSTDCLISECNLCNVLPFKFTLKLLHGITIYYADNSSYGSLGQAPAPWCILHVKVNQSGTAERFQIGIAQV